MWADQFANNWTAHNSLIYKQTFHPVIGFYTKYYIRLFETDSSLPIQYTNNIKKP